MENNVTLDQILPTIKGKMIALFGDLSSNRNNLIKQFILDGLQEEGSSCIISLIQSASALIDELSNVSPEAAMQINDAILNENLQILDLYSFRGTDDNEEIPGVHFLSSAKDLTMISIKLNEISQRHSSCRFILWPFSLLAVYTNPNDLIGFTQTLAARFNNRGQTGLLISDNGVIPESTRATVESIVDSIIETKREEVDGNVNEWIRIKFFKGYDSQHYDTWSQFA